MGASFRGRATFDGAELDGKALLHGASFAQEANLVRSKIAKGAYFGDAGVGRNGFRDYLEGAVFSNLASFYSSTFSSELPLAVNYERTTSPKMKPLLIVSVRPPLFAYLDLQISEDALTIVSASPHGHRCWSDMKSSWIGTSCSTHSRTYSWKRCSVLGGRLEMLTQYIGDEDIGRVKEKRDSTGLAINSCEF
jgi:hypothetical protein